MILAALIILWGVYAYFDAKEEAAWSWPFREFSWIELDPQKGRLSGKAHLNGAAGIFTMLVITSGLYGLYMGGWLAAGAAFVVSGLSYWLIFDVAYALEIGQKWHYLGSTAKTDRIVKNGKVKAIVCASLILTILILTLVFG